MYGAHLKASAAMVRLRLYDVLALLPPETFEGKFTRTKIQTNFNYLKDTSSRGPSIWCVMDW